MAISLLTVSDTISMHFFLGDTDNCQLFPIPWKYKKVSAHKFILQHVQHCIEKQRIYSNKMLIRLNAEINWVAFNTPKIIIIWAK